jgi:hypothetical protein
MFYLTIAFHLALCIFCVYFISLSLSRANGASYLWQMVRMRTGDFTQDAGRELPHHHHHHLCRL